MRWFPEDKQGEVWRGTGADAPGAGPDLGSHGALIFDKMASKRRSRYDGILDVIFDQFLSPLGCGLGRQDASQIEPKSIQIGAQMPSHVDWIF